jgi:MFS family permease
MPDAPPPLPVAVRWFGVASLMTDAAGELVYPLLPLFLTSVLGGSAAFVGVIEGVAESTAALLKLVSGKISDRLSRRKPLILFGYGLTSAARPLLALAASQWSVLVIRFFDRAGKGIRGSPRDAMLADLTPSQFRGRAYGYHQAMDNAGAVIGPLAGFAMMSGLHLGLRTIFAWTALPGALAILALLAIREPARGQAKAREEAPERDAPGDSAALVRYLVVLSIFTLGNASDAFLLLRAAEVLHPGAALGSAALADPTLLLLWSVHNAVKAALSYRGGALADRYGRRLTIGIGWTVYAAIYLAFGFASSPWQIWCLFAGYGLYYSLVEGAEKALVAELVPSHRRGSGFGWTNAVIGVLSLPASALFGFLFARYGAAVPFEVAAGLAATAAMLLWLLVRPATKTPPRPRPARA